MANSFIVIVVLHIVGIVVHTVKHKDPIGKSMIHGHKWHVPDTELSVASHRVSGLLVLALSLGVGGYLLGNYNPDSRTLSIAGNTLQLTEFEEGGYEYGHDDDHEEGEN